MSELGHVFIRHAGWIDKVQIESEENGVIRTNRTKNGIEATCYPDGRADIVKFSLLGKEVYKGFGVWNDTKVDIPTGVRIRITKGTRIWNISTSRYMVLAASIVVYADEDLEEMEYVFKYDLLTCTIGMEDATTI